MNEKLIKQVKDFKPNVREVTINKYFYYLKSLHNEIFGKEEFNDFEWAKDFNSVMENIKDKNYLSQRNILNAVIVALTSEDDIDVKTIEKYSILRDNFNEKYKEDVKTRTNDDIITKSELKYIIDEFERVIKCKRYKSRKDLNKKELYEFQLYVILKFYEAHPLRADMPTFKFITSNNKREEGVNYYLVDKSVIVLSNYKTSAKYGTINIELDFKIHTLLRSLIKKKIDINNNYLITKQNGNAFSKTEFSNLIVKFFKQKSGKNIGVTALRRVYLTKYTEVKQEMKADAEQMCHSVAVQQEVYVD
tara:strand:- start:203 stop:1117 length:915 start_codon:yes stop_codon:yes gene_type:complete